MFFYSWFVENLCVDFIFLDSQENVTSSYTCNQNS